LGKNKTLFKSRREGEARLEREHDQRQRRRADLDVRSLHWRTGLNGDSTILMPKVAPAEGEPPEPPITH
jgi:hypothetical protein